jgi:hypothetical protein
MIFCVIAPVFLASFLIGNKENIGDEDFVGAYAFLVRDFKGASILRLLPCDLFS